MYSMQLTRGALTAGELDQTQLDRIKALLVTHPGVEHIRVRHEDRVVRIWAFLAAPNLVTALPLISEVRATLSAGLPGWQLVPDSNFASGS
jgi:hypothetical protein